jgi:hypothetical protein
MALNQKLTHVIAVYAGANGWTDIGSHRPGCTWKAGVRGLMVVGRPYMPPPTADAQGEFLSRFSAFCPRTISLRRTNTRCCLHSPISRSNWAAILASRCPYRPIPSP